MSSRTCYRTKVFFFTSRRRHTRYWRDWSSDVCSSDLKKQSQRNNQAKKLQRKKQNQRNNQAKNLQRKKHSQQIGRASCRERVSISVAAVSLKTKRATPKRSPSSSSPTIGTHIERAASR